MSSPPACAIFAETRATAQALGVELTSALGVAAALAPVGATGVRLSALGAAGEVAEVRARARAVLGGRADWAVAPALPACAVLVSDMDSTVIGQECIDELAAMAGLRDQIAPITAAAMAGELDFAQALQARVKALAGLEVSALQACLDARVRLNPGAAALVARLSAQGALTALVSGGFTFFTERVAAAAGFTRHFGNTLEIADGRLTGGLSGAILGAEEKRDLLAALCAEVGAPTQAALALGDGANDALMIQAAGLGLAYRAKPGLRACAHGEINHGDLTRAADLWSALAG
ncbi:MAG: phosphoserine phosphatase SerB [Maricaulaceae bacterium]